MCSRNASCLFEVGKVKSSRVGSPPPFFVPNGGLVRMTSAGSSAAPCGESGGDLAIEPVTIADQIRTQLQVALNEIENLTNLLEGTEGERP